MINNYLPKDHIFALNIVCKTTYLPIYNFQCPCQKIKQILINQNSTFLVVINIMIFFGIYFEGHFKKPYDSKKSQFPVLIFLES